MLGSYPLSSYTLGSMPLLGLSAQNISNAGGIASLEAFGTANLNLNILVSGIATAEAFGTPTLNLNILTSGIASAEAFGTANLSLNILVSGIATAEAFGTPNFGGLLEILDAGGIASAEAFGMPAILTTLSGDEVYGNSVYGDIGFQDVVPSVGIYIYASEISGWGS